MSLSYTYTYHNYTKLLQEVEKTSHSLALSSLIFAAMLIVIAIAIALIHFLTSRDYESIQYT
jgi:hypothetical protein